MSNLRENLQPTCNQLATDCISRQAAIDCLQDEFSIHDKRDVITVQQYIQRVNMRLRTLSSAQPERKRGKWIEKTDEYGSTVVCSECGDEYAETDLSLDSWVKQYFHFCPNCGCEMKGEQA